MQSRFLILAAVLVATACGSPPPDPTATLTVRGRLIGVDGAPAAFTSVLIYRVDAPLGNGGNFLQDRELAKNEAIRARYTAETDGSGFFTMTLSGKQLQAEYGDGPAYLAAVYFDQGTEGPGPATATSWYSFHDGDSVWSVGDLELWDGPTATQTGEIIELDWSSVPVPAGNSPVEGMPSTLFAWDTTSAASTPTWAQRTLGTSAQVPRSVFVDAVRPPEFFVTTFSQGPADGQIYLHRSSFQGHVTGWAASDTLAIGGIVLYAGGTDTPIDDSAALDGDMDTAYAFPAGTSELYIDLDPTGFSPGGVLFNDVLLYNLSIVGIENAEISLDVSSDLDDNPDRSTWTPLGDVIVVDGSVEDWIYIGNTVGSTARWIRVSVNRRAASGTLPELGSLSDVRIFQ